MKVLLPGIILALSLGAGGAQATVCSQTGVDLRGEWGQAHFTVEVADDEPERAQGLMFRERLAASSGMLFIYDSPQRVRFWMRNTLIALDLVFIDRSGQVLRIKHNAQPLDETPIDGGDGVLMVLEINGGMAKGLGISVGSHLRHPGLDSAAALWPCP